MNICQSGTGPARRSRAGARSPSTVIATSRRRACRAASRRSTRPCLVSCSTSGERPSCSISSATSTGPTSSRSAPAACARRMSFSAAASPRPLTADISSVTSTAPAIGPSAPVPASTAAVTKCAKPSHGIVPREPFLGGSRVLAHCACAQSLEQLLLRAIPAVQRPDADARAPPRSWRPMRACRPRPRRCVPPRAEPDRCARPPLAEQPSCRFSTVPVLRNESLRRNVSVLRSRSLRRTEGRQ